MRDRWEMLIWTVGYDKWDFNDFLSEFKVANPRYANTSFKVESFSNYQDYTATLQAAVFNETAPDIFVVNNNDTSWIENLITWVPPTKIDPDNFRANFDPVFWNDLILNAELEQDWEMKQVDFLKWVPLGYDTLWMYFNLRFLKWKDLSTFAWINAAIWEITNQKSWVVPLWVWDWSSVFHAEDIISQFFLQDSVLWVDFLSAWWDGSIIRYHTYWNEGWNNKYDKLDKEWLSNYDYFSRWNVLMVFGYMRSIKEIARMGFKKAFLRAVPFPQFTKTDWITLVDYYYFAVNKFSNKTEVAYDLLNYFTTEEGGKEFIKRFDFLLPAQLGLLSYKVGDRIHDDFLVKYKDFYNSSATLSSFNKKLVDIYNQEIITVLDDKKSFSDRLKKLWSKINCINKKLKNFSWFEVECHK